MERNESPENTIDLGAVSRETRGFPIGAPVDNKGLLRGEGMTAD